IAIIAPRKVENVGLRATGRELGTEPFAVGEMLEIESEIDGQPSAVRPSVVGAAAQRHIVIPIVCSEAHRSPNRSLPSASVPHNTKKLPTMLRRLLSAALASSLLLFTGST